MKTLLIALILSALAGWGCSGSKPAPHTQIAHSFGQRAFTCFNSGDFACALVNYDKAFQHAAFSDEPLLQAGYLFNMGRVYFELERYDSAAAIFKNAMEEFAFYNDSSNLRSAAAFCAMSLALGGDSEGGNQFCRQSLFLQNITNPVFYYTVKARIAFARNDLTQAGIFLDSVSLTLKKKSDPAVLGLHCYYRGVLALSEKQFSRSQMFLDSALFYMDKSTERFRRWKILIALSSANFCSGDPERGTRYYYRAKDCVPTGVMFPLIEIVKEFYCNRQ